MIAEGILPDPKIFIKHEVDTLAFLKDSPYMLQWHNQFALDAGQLHGQLRSSGHWFDFHSMLDFQHADRPLRVFFAGQLTPKGKKRDQYAMATYCLTVCERVGNGLQALRKLHFDVCTPDAGEGRIPKPLCHLQCSGQLSPYLQGQGLSNLDIDQFHPWLDEPRLFLWPACTAILLHLVLHEFQHRDSATFREQPEWRNIVWKSEQLILKTYYAKCSEVLENKRKDNRILADVLYSH
jgi:hypothetical protein